MRKTDLSKAATIARSFITAELERLQGQVTEKWDGVAIGVSDEGEIDLFPCRFILPFHYPRTIAELDEFGPSHFDFLHNHWTLRRQQIPEFGTDDERSEEAEREFRIQALRIACAELDVKFSIFKLDSDNTEWWEVNAIHIAGPPMPPPPDPTSDVQILSRLRRHVNLAIGKYAFPVKAGRIAEVSFGGANTTDRTIDLLREVENLRELLSGLQKLNLESTLVTQKSLDFLAHSLPHVQVVHSNFHDDFGRDD